MQFKFAVQKAHFTTGLVERRMRMVHDFIGKLNMQGTGMSVSDLSLMFQYVACKINTIPYGIKNINTVSATQLRVKGSKQENNDFCCHEYFISHSTLKIERNLKTE